MVLFGGFIRWFYLMVSLVAESLVLHLMREEKTWNSFHRKSDTVTVPILHPINPTQVTKTSTLMRHVWHKAKWILRLSRPFLFFMAFYSSSWTEVFVNLSGEILEDRSTHQVWKENEQTMSFTTEVVFLGFFPTIFFSLFLTRESEMEDTTNCTTISAYFFTFLTFVFVYIFEWHVKNVNTCIYLVKMCKNWLCINSVKSYRLPNVPKRTFFSFSYYFVLFCFSHLYIIIFFWIYIFVLYFLVLDCSTVFKFLWTCIFVVKRTWCFVA